MKLQRTELIPRAAAPARAFGLRHFFQAHHDTIKVLRCVFERLRNGDVDVMNARVHFCSELFAKPAAASNCFSRSATPPGCAPRYALKSAERFRGMLNDVHSADRKCFARKTIWPM